MKAILFLSFLSLSLNLTPSPYKFEDSMNLDISNPPKIKEIFNMKTNSVHDINGMVVDLDLYDRVSSLISFYGPNKEHIIIGGLGARDYDNDTFPYNDTYFEKNCIIRSIDGGQTWTALTPKGKTDRKVYGLSTNNKGVVVAVTGDREHSCILSSVDYGLTWKVAISNEDLNYTEHELYNSYYSKSRDLFLIPVGDNITYTTSDGINFSKGEYDLPLARNGYVFEELDEIWIASQWDTNYLNVLKPREKKYEKVLKSKNEQYFSTVKYLGNDIFVALSYTYPGSNKTDLYASKFERKNNYLFLTITNHNLTTGMVTMDIKKDSSMYSTMQNGLDFQVVDKDIIKMYQKGNDITVDNINLLIRVYKDEDMAKPYLYRSTDHGVTWKSKELRGATFSHGMVWSRDITYIGNGVLYMNFAGDENAPEYECAMIIKSTDYGQNWEITDDILGEGNEKLNAIYRSVVDIDGTIIAGAQGNGRILKFMNSNSYSLILCLKYINLVFLLLLF